MVCGPEVARVVREFQQNPVLRQTIKTEYSHKEDRVAFQKRFKTHGGCFATVIKKNGNPFIISDEEGELVQIDTRDVIEFNIVKSINEIQRVSK